MAEVRTDEDRIIETLLIDGLDMANTYDDVDFLPVRQSLYNVQTVTPEYDDEISPHIVWCRPATITENPEYFTSNPRREFPSYCAKQGTLPDEVFIGALLALSAYQKTDLIQNVFASRPEDFKTHGVYTCRFYVEGEWVEVITDTMLPCIRDEVSGSLAPVYSRSANPTEMWISLAEKAYAKAVGSYEAIQKVRIHEALLHLTGGSVQQIALSQEQKASEKGTASFNMVTERLDDDTMMLVLPTEEKTKAPEAQTDEEVASTSSVQGDNQTGNPSNQSRKDSSSLQPPADAFFLQNKLYSVIASKSLGGFELVLLHSPWHESSECWTGDWSQMSHEWETYPEILQEIAEDPLIPWSRYNPNGYFWMSFKSFLMHFSSAYFVKLFPSNKFDFYCARGEWKKKEAGGPVHTIRDRSVVAADSLVSKMNAVKNDTAAVVIDGDTSWFNNPQFRVYTKHNQPANIFISVLPVGTPETDGFQVVAFDLCAGARQASSGSSAPSPHLWDCSGTEMIATEKVDGAGRVKGQEVSLWEYAIDPRHYYHVVPHTMRRGQEGGFILRIFSSAPVVVEQVANLFYASRTGDWKRTAEIDTTGGPLMLLQDVPVPLSQATHSQNLPALPPIENALAMSNNGKNILGLSSNGKNPNATLIGAKETAVKTSVSVMKENTKWCQNPQYHLELENHHSKDDMFLKIVIRRVEAPEKKGGSNHSKPSSHTNSDAKDSTIGAVICRASFLEGLGLGSSGGRKKGPRENAMGEIIPCKASSLKKKQFNSSDDAEDGRRRYPTEESKSGIEKKRVVIREKAILPDMYHLQIGYNNKSETCVLYPRVPKAWLANGFIIVPSLSEKGVKGHFELEVFSSEPVKLTQLPESNSRMIAGDWSEATAGGSHLNSLTFKKNPKFILKLKRYGQGRNSSNDRDRSHSISGIEEMNGLTEPMRTRITVSRVGNNWKGLMKKDTVGCMIGFYIFIRRNATSTPPTNSNAPLIANAAPAQSHELTQIYESTFVPDHEACTEKDFTLGHLGPDEEYVLVPTTFGDGKIGAFVVSVASTSEFSFTIEKKSN